MKSFITGVAYFVVSFLVSTVSAHAGEDSVILYYTKAQEGYRTCQNYFSSTDKVRYAFGLRCDARLALGDCEKVTPFYGVQNLSKPNDKMHLFYATRSYSGDEISTFAKNFRSHLRTFGRDGSPFFGPAFWVTEASGFGAMILFPLTIPVDVVTMPIQLSVYWIERLMRSKRYRQILNTMEGFASGKIDVSKKPATVNSYDSFFTLRSDLPSSSPQYCPGEWGGYLSEDSPR